MPREHKEGPTVRDLQVLLKTENVTIDALYNLFKEKPNLRGHFDDREELEALCTDLMDENNAMRAHLLIDNLYDHAYWHGYNVAESEVESDN